MTKKTLHIQQLSKMSGNNTIIPTMELTLASGQCAAIQCNPDIGYQLIELLLGLTPASNGSVQWDGIELSQVHRKTPEQIGVCLRHDGVYERLKVRQYLHYFCQLYGVSTSPIDEIIRRVGLWDKKELPCSKLTFSEQRRLHLGRSIIHRPELLILEEMEQNIDLESCIIVRQVIAHLQEQGTAIFMTTSSMEDAVSITSDVYSLRGQQFKKIELESASESVQQSTAAMAQTDDIPADPPASTIPVDTDTTPAIPTNDEASAPVQESIIESDDVPPSSSESPIQTYPMRIEKIPAKVNDKIILFDPTEILFIESNEGVSQLHVNEGVFPCAIKLGDLEEKLKLFGFFRCHRSYIVNLQHVREVITWTRNSYSLILDDKSKSSIPLSKGKFDELRAIIGI
ncbi:LytTR family transcriptional regulator DNA-binding domain-containing protein [Paenibacillus guangzhouensis]|uniref:LytTR family transcriptional regulator DNA-binding domain-containing protein n=1 Tax=Paenibacillus guangzhouensis TaxID=1473112 RepID=UPI002AAF2378|nr:LytTR family transcriptional regulator DNA-binding domain-containing protein [Paenibacillus guangzhouensis]